jgi:tRNA threonylcarbamoyladenosine biosynthesis protein TsaE
LRESDVELTAEGSDETRRLGRRFAAALVAADPAGPVFVALTGELGAGKTTFVAGVLAALGHQGVVRSPTYTLVEPYSLPGREVHHCDLYRLRDPEEIEDLGLRDLRGGRHWLLVEWSERAGDRLGSPDLEVHFDYQDSGRILRFSGRSPTGRAVLEHFRLDPD